MVEKLLVINHRQIKYKGIFRADELFSTINRALGERGYVKKEKKTEELVKEEGRKTYVELRPYKVVTNFATLMIKIMVNLDNIIETVEEIDGEKKKFQKGNMDIFFDSWVMTDYESRWGMKPLFYLLKAVIHKFIHAYRLEGSFPDIVTKDTAFVYGKIRKLLDSYRVEIGKYVPEEEVMKKVAEEVMEE